MVVFDHLHQCGPKEKQIRRVVLGLQPQKASKARHDLERVLSY